MSSQRVDLKDALYNAVKGKEEVKEAAVNPLVEDGKKLIPSVTRVFSQGKQIYVYLQAYQESATADDAGRCLCQLLSGTEEGFRNHNRSR